jgi:hypothetical protein
MLCLVSPESVVPADHPLRAIKRMVETVLRELSPVFDEMYAKTGRPSVPPERLLKATLLMAFYTIRSERMFSEQLSFVAACRERRISPHVAQNRNRRRSAIDGRTTSASGYGVSISLRRMIERIFGWMKTTANFRRTRLRGLAKTAMLGTFVGAAYNILRLVRLTEAAA